MNVTKRWLRRTYALAATAAIVTACADTTTIAAPRSATLDRAAELGTCDSLRVPVESKVALRAYATGVQIYRWSGTAWSFVAPSATLTADAGGNGVVATHYAGPTWESNSGSKVVAAVMKRCVPDANAIPWLLLRATSNSGPGVFERAAYVQRVNTVGGNAPATPGAQVGDIVNVPYSAEYYFYSVK